MPVRMRRLPSGRYRVTHGGKTSARSSTRRNAQQQANLLRGIEHGWHPTRRHR